VILASVALRLLESSGVTWWLVTVPEGEELAVAHELSEELAVHVDSVRTWPGSSFDVEPDTGPHVSVFAVSDDVVDALSHRLDAERSRLAEHGVIAFVVAERNARAFLNAAPHVASFIGGKVLDTTIEEAPPVALFERRLDSLRSTYQMTDQQARALFERDDAPESLDFLEWMMLLEARSKASADGS